MNRLYIAGPMSGLPDNNYPAFNAAAVRLRNMGFAVENPAENNVPACGSWEGYMRISIRQMMTCDTVVLLQGWCNSKGAMIERDLALEIGMRVLTLDQVDGDSV